MRPRSFEDVIGLEDTVKAIKSRIDEKGAPHVILLRGSYGCGKTTLALIIAKYIQGPFFEGTPDVMEINGANYRKIDDMRALVESTGSYSFGGGKRVIIMDEAQQLTKDAQQVLLKELELPSSPTVWILCTTDPQKINQGVLDRCLTFEVGGMNEEQRKLLITRAAMQMNHEGDTDDFEKAVSKAKLASPRKILMAFEKYHCGIEAGRAVNSCQFMVTPEYFDIAMGVVYGQWSKDYLLFKKEFKSVAAQLKNLEDDLKKKPKNEEPTVAEGEDEPVPADEDDAVGTHNKLEAASALRNITAALLKNAILKIADKPNKVSEVAEKAEKASKALEKLLRCMSWNNSDFGTEFSATVNGLYQVNQAMKTASKEVK